jgi:hypothetical protein
MEQQEIESLKVEHSRLKHEIKEEYSRAVPDGTLIAELKRRKLQIKDKIAAMETT